MKLLVKGIQTREDAELAITYGVDGIVVSNHGGRAGASGRATIESLPEIAAGVNGRIPIILDTASGAAPTSSRRWPWVPPPSGSVVPTSGGWAHSARKVSRRCSTCCAASCRW
jgi:hypothetical protein